MASALGLLAASAADAAGPYVEVGAGVTFAANSEASFFAVPGGVTDLRAEFETGYHTSGAVGYRFTEYLRAEANVGFRMADLARLQTRGGTLFVADPADNPLTTPQAARVQVPVPPSNGSDNGGLDVVSGLVNGYLDLNPDARVRPYIGAGVGVGYVDWRTRSTSTGIDIDDDSVEFAWNVMAGLSIEVTEQIILNVGYRFFSTADGEYTAKVPDYPGPQPPLSSPTNPPLRTLLRDVEVDIAFHELVFGVRFEF